MYKVIIRGHYDIDKYFSEDNMTEDRIAWFIKRIANELIDSYAYIWDCEVKVHELFDGKSIVIIPYGGCHPKATTISVIKEEDD